nr:class II aldolase/adducin family protein [uncultured Anaeromusa sp.]
MFEASCQQLVLAGQTLLAKGLVAGTWGNLSLRVAENQVAVTPSGRDYDTMTSKDIVVVDLSGKTVHQASDRNASSETPLHLAIYRQRPDIMAIVHTHSVHASACAVAHKPIPPVIEDVVQLAGGEIPLAPYALPGTQELAAQAAATLGSKQAVLLANHGVVCCGTTLAEAMTAAELVEKAAQIYLYANLLGGAKALSDEDVSIMHEFYVSHYRKRRGDIRND